MIAEFNKVIDTIEGKNFVHKVVEFFVDRSREKMKDSVFKPLEDNLAKVYYEKYLETEDLSALQEEYTQNLVNCNQAVRVLDIREGYTGTARGINARGELLVLTGDRIRKVSAGEVSVRGVYGYV